MYFLDPFVLLRSKLKLHDSEPRCRVGVGRGEIGGSNILTPGLQCFCTKIHIFLCTITLAHKSLPLLPCPKPQELPVTGLCLLHLQIPHHFPDRIQTTESVSIDKCGRGQERSRRTSHSPGFISVFRFGTISIPDSRDFLFYFRTGVQTRFKGNI